MSKQKCDARAPLGTCPKGPKGRHKCGLRSARATDGNFHTQHLCKHCNQRFT